MASEKITAIIEELKTLTVLELSELVHAVEDEFGVSAAAAVVAAGPVAAEGGAAAEEKSDFNVVLANAGDAKLKVVKAVRDLTGLGLKEAKDLVEGAPKVLKEGVSKEDAAKIKETVEAAGGTVKIA